MDNVSLSRTSAAPAAQNTVKDNKEKSSSNEFNDVLKDEVQLNKTSQVIDKKEEADESSVDGLENRADSQAENSDEEPIKSEDGLDGSNVVLEAEIVDEALQLERQLQGNSLPMVAIAGSVLAGEGSKKTSDNEAKIKSASIISTELTTDAKVQANTKPLSQLAQSVESEENAIKFDNKFQIEAASSLLTNKNQSSEKTIDTKMNMNSSVLQASLASQQLQVPAVSSISSINNPINSLITDGTNPSLTAPLQTSISTSVQNPAWSQNLVEKLNLMVNGQLQRAEIKLNPANLGSMEIQLSIKDDQATVNFVSPHAQVREAIDQAMPRLREMLEQQGLNLVDVDVSQYSDQQQGDSESSELNQSKLAQENSNEAEIESISVQENIQLNIESGVSIYA